MVCDLYQMQTGDWKQVIYTGGQLHADGYWHRQTETACCSAVLCCFCAHERDRKGERVYSL